jgi:SAM-dependent methyltransferase
VRCLGTLAWSYFHYGYSIKEKIPWMPFRAIQWLDAYIGPQSVVFEYGSGTSTLRWAKRAKRLISVEHVPLWQAKVKAALEREGLRNCEVRLVLADSEPDQGSVDPSDPETYASRGSKDTFKAYVYQVETFPDNSFDIVIVDGRARPAALRHATKKVKPGGFVLLDDANRPSYQRSLRYVASWEKVDLSGIKYDGKFQTTIAWKKPV